MMQRKSKPAAAERAALKDPEVAADTALALQNRLVRHANGKISNARELVARLALQLYLIDAGLRDLDEDAPVEAAILVEQTTRGVAAAHAERIIHRDLKPANILLTASHTDGADDVRSTIGGHELTQRLLDFF